MEHEDTKEDVVSRRRGEGGGQGLPLLSHQALQGLEFSRGGDHISAGSCPPPTPTPRTAQPGPGYPVLLAVTWAKHECSGHTLLLSET